MLEGLELLGQFFMAWRMFLVWGVTFVVDFLLATHLSSETAMWILCTSIGVAGFAGGIWWQFASDWLKRDAGV